MLGGIAVNINHTKDVAERIYSISQADELGICDEQFRKGAIQDAIYYHVNDIISLISNINQTSFNAEDKKTRLLDLENKTGIRGIYDKFK